MPLINVPISDAAAEKLRRLAALEFRRPKDQAAVLILEGLERFESPTGTPPAGQMPTAAEHKR